MKRALLFVCTLLACPALAVAGSAPLVVHATGADGAGTSASGVFCPERDSGSSWSFTYSAALPGGAMSGEPAQLELQLEVRSEAPFDRAWLADGSNAVLGDARGTVKLGLQTAGACGDASLAFDGTTVAGGGSWTVIGTGSYRDVTGSGTFQLTAQVAPGSQNVFQLQLDGVLAVPDADLAVELVSARWEPGADAGDRTALATFRIRNVGPGDAFDVQVVDAASSTPNVTSVSGPAGLGDVAANGSVLVERRFLVARPRPHTFDVTFDVDVSDALDNARLLSRTLSIRVPTHPGSAPR